MRTTILSLGASALLLAAPAFAQTTGAAWRPFRVGHTYTFQRSSAGQELETVRLEAGRLAGADSVYTFHDFYRDVTGNEVYPAHCSQIPAARFRRETNTPVGAELVVPAGGADYLVRFTDSTAYRLPRRPPVAGTSWALTPGVTATLTRREMRSVGAGSGGVTDSVWVAALSTGGQVVVSKAFGLVDAPHLRALAAGAASAFELHLLTIPERALGTLVPASLAAWQVGDSLVWTSMDYLFANPSFSCSSGLELTTYTAQTFSANADTAYLHGVIQRATTYSGPPTCGGATGTFVQAPAYFRSARYIGAPGPTGPLPGQLLRQAGGGGAGYVNTRRWYVPATPSECAPGWRTRYESYFGVDSCRQTLDAMLDQGGWYETVDGFGRIRAVSVNGEGQLLWYRRGG